MIDYWEALGRLVYTKGLFSEFKRVLGPPDPIPWIGVTVNKVTATCLNIPKERYTRVQHFLTPLLTEGMVSLFVAGELIWTFSYPKMRDVFDSMHALIAQGKQDANSPSTSYFIALGLVLVDPLFRQEVAGSEVRRAKLLPRLTHSQHEQLAALLNDKRFDDLVREFEFNWDEGCFSRKLWWPGYVHPLAVDSQKNEAGGTGDTSYSEAGV